MQTRKLFLLEERIPVNPFSTKLTLQMFSFKNWGFKTKCEFWRIFPLLCVALPLQLLGSVTVLHF